MPFEDLNEDQIHDKLSLPNNKANKKDTRFQDYFTNPIQPAAVLIPFLRPFGPNSPWHILLTRRTNHVADHKGQVAFPGGRSEPNEEEPILTALREAQEEIGLNPEDVKILGTLSTIQTISNYLVTPVVGVIPWPYNFKLEEREVSKIFILPLVWLANSQNYHIKNRSVKFPNSSTPIQLNVCYYKPYNNETLWGVSAEITHQLISKLN